MMLSVKELNNRTRGKKLLVKSVAKSNTTKHDMGIDYIQGITNLTCNFFFAWRPFFKQIVFDDFSSEKIF